MSTTALRLLLWKNWSDWRKEELKQNVQRWIWLRIKMNSLFSSWWSRARNRKYSLICSRHMWQRRTSNNDTAKPADQLCEHADRWINDSAVLVSDAVVRVNITLSEWCMISPHWPKTDSDPPQAHVINRRKPPVNQTSLPPSLLPGSLPNESSSVGHHSIWMIFILSYVMDEGEDELHPRLHQHHISYMGEKRQEEYVRTSEKWEGKRRWREEIEEGRKERRKEVKRGQEG